MRLFVATCLVAALLTGSQASVLVECMADSGNLNDVKECDVDQGMIKKISIKREYSTAACIRDETYGITIDDRSIWVSGACKAMFVLRTEPPSWSNSCSGNGAKLWQFNGKRKEDTTVPCKFHAVRQKCGRYFINLTPGNIWRYPRYYLDTLWLGVQQLDREDFWEGRTENKIAVKFYNGYTRDLFNKKNGTLSTADLLTFGKNGTVTWAEAKDGSFRVSFKPWDPDSNKFKLSEWKFECFDPDFQPAPYPEQVCGGWRTTETKTRKSELELQNRASAIYYDIFGNQPIEQTFPQCIEAENVFIKTCSEDQKIDSLLICSEILSKNVQTKCVTKYSCHPMDAFLACLKWVCSDFKDDISCYNVGNSIDMCPAFVQGNLTALINKANCYKDFLTIID